jgi:hypothetical protein
MHLNIAGGKEHHANIAIADKLADSVASRRPGLPLAVSVNEVCFNQWERLYNRLTALGYSGHFGLSRWTTDRDRCGAQPYGNAIFWQGGHADATTFYFSQQAPGAVELRNMACGKAHFPERTWYCSAHLINGNEEMARRQAGDALNIATVLEVTDRAIIMGDFNLTPDDDAMKRWFNRSWDDADDCRCRPTNDGLRSNGNRKIDYILVRRDEFSFGHDAYITSDVDSDHSLMQGCPVFR